MPYQPVPRDRPIHVSSRAARQLTGRHCPWYWVTATDMTYVRIVYRKLRRAGDDPRTARRSIIILLGATPIA